MNTSPLVTVICLCYNQAQWIEEAVQSVRDQTYPNIQLIIVDDASTDGSADRIKNISKDSPEADVILLPQNVGNCRAFNIAFERAKGEYIIDLAGDDVLVYDRVEKQVALFAALPEEVGVIFTDAEYIDAEGKFLRTHFGYMQKKGLLKRIPEGDVFKDVLSTYFIPSPTMMMRRAVLERLGGYDEGLAYEDFDFWVRSSRYFRYAYLPEKLTRVRKSKQSMSVGSYRRGDRQLHSTYLVCRKAVALCRDADERAALLRRVRYEFKQATFSGNREEATLFHRLLKELTTETPGDKIIYWFLQSGIPLAWLRRLYNRWRFG